MPNIKLAFAQTNPTVGDFSGNAEVILSEMKKAHGLGVQLLVFGELALCGYPMGDFSYRTDLVSASESELASLVEASKSLAGLTVVLGYMSLSSHRPSNQVSRAIAHNSLAVFGSGEVLGRYHKKSLPNYDVFDDWRNFVPGTEELILEIAGTKVGFAICEDIWGLDSQSSHFRSAGVELIVSIHGSPYTKDKRVQRRSAARSFQQGIALAYGNLSGGQDELVFDGNSFYLNEFGEEEFSAPAETGLYLVEQGKVLKIEPIEVLFRVLVTGLRDYMAKTGQKSVVLGLSGGIDSALCAAIATEALGASNVLGVGLPSRYSSEHSLHDARKLAKNLGIHYREVPIDPAHKAFEKMISLSDLAAENTQARIRAVTLMAISNTEGHLLLTTGNKSEVAVGYSTIYGDSAGGFAPIKDVYKTVVWELARFYNELRGAEIIPESSITKPPSAELRPGQLDQDSLPDYAILDTILEHLIEGGCTTEEVKAKGFAESTVRDVELMLARAEWKRSQGAIGTKVSNVAFGRGRRVPLTTRFNF